MKTNAVAWKCEIAGCGYVWLATGDEPPRRCAKCKRSGWHQTKTTAELIRSHGPDFDSRVRAIVLDILAERNPAVLPPVADPSSPALGILQQPSDRIGAVIASAASHLRIPATISTASTLPEVHYERDDYSQ